VYVNYLDYDIFSHAWGPRHRRALRSLRSVDRSLRVLWRTARRVPEHRYDIYVLADHGQAHCTPYDRLNGGRRIERLLFEDFLNPAGAHEVAPGRAQGRHLSTGIKAIRTGRAAGAVQRFINYIEHDFPWMLGELKEAREEGGVRVIAAGPNAFVYLIDEPTPLDLERVEQRFPGLAEKISRSRGMGFVLARSTDGPVCYWRGQRYGLAHLGAGPFAGRADLGLVEAGIRDLMAMPSAGDLVLYGLEAVEGHVSFIAETGAHAGPTEDEMQTFIISPPDVGLSTPITHPLQLYPHFVRYQVGA